ncbi:MAG: hypothetical protein MUE96_05380 [Bacteroidia bacterium]|jgi:hypothetical protein|nr:hypothetical protein [Bacteroidia bacterium]
MKTITLLLLAHITYLVHSQDYLKLTDGKELNVKIIQVKDSLMTYRHQGSDVTINVNKVEQIMYNQEPSKRSNQYLKDTLKPPLLKHTPVVITPEAHLQTARAFQLVSGVFLLGGITLAGVYAFNEPPTFESVYGNYALDQIMYQAELESYEYSQKLIVAGAITSIGLGSVFMLVAQSEMIQAQRKTNKSISFRPNGNGLSLTYHIH